MLRREADTILIGEEIEIHILECSRGHVKLGLVVPKRLAIVRGEIRQVSEQNRSAARGAGAELPALLARRLRQEMGNGRGACAPDASPVAPVSRSRPRDTE
ncbi:carbon storage regulator [Paludibaculum fermentans]|nr:carbon storage regulator [Paludibaculum fermentans]